MGQAPWQWPRGTAAACRLPPQLGMRGAITMGEVRCQSTSSHPGGYPDGSAAIRQMWSLRWVLRWVPRWVLATSDGLVRCQRPDGYPDGWGAVLGFVGLRALEPLRWGELPRWAWLPLCLCIVPCSFFLSCFCISFSIIFLVCFSFLFISFLFSYSGSVLPRLHV